VEVACGVEFHGSQPWDPTVLGLFYSRARDDFPLRRQVGGGADGARARQEQPRGNLVHGTPMRFLPEDQRASVQLDPDSLALSHFPPYPGWGRYKALFLLALDHYRHAVAPEGITRASLRYVNRISIESREVTLEDYLLAAPHVPEALRQTMAPFSMEVHIPYSELGAAMRVCAAAPPSGETTVAFELDLSITGDERAQVSFASLEAWLDRAHAAIEHAFGACWGPRARDLIGLEVDTGG